MKPCKHGTRNRYAKQLAGVAAGALLTITACVFAPVAQASPEDDKVTEAKAAEAKVASSIGDIEAQLAQANDDAQAAQARSEMADWALNDAKSNLVLAEQQLGQAQKDASEANKKVEQAKKELAEISRKMYTSQGSLSSATPYLSNNGLQTAEMKKVASDLFGSKAEAQMQTFDSIMKVAKVINQRVETNKKEKENAVKEVEKQKREAEAVKAEVNQRLGALTTTKQTLIGDLAKARGVTEKAEQERQAKIEADKKAAEEAAARKALAEAEAKAKAEKEAKEKAEKEAKAKAEAERKAKEKAEAPAPADQAKPSARPQTPAKPKVNEPSAPKKPVAQPKPAPAPQQGRISGAAVVAYAKNFLGRPYVWGGNGPNVFDCSGLTSYVYRHFGINLPRTSQMQRGYGRTISRSQAQPGDMVNYWGHVGIYIGNGYMIHAPHPGDHVRIAKVYGNPIYKRVL